MLSEIKSSKEMLAARRASRPAFKRFRLTESQRAAYYGYSEFITNESYSDETINNEKIDEKVQLHESSKRLSQNSSETSKASIVFRESVLAAFDKTNNREEEISHQKTISDGPSETAKASIVFRESVLAAFDKTDNRDVEEEEVSHQRTIPYGPSETSKASVTFSKSVLAAFDKTNNRDETEVDRDETEEEISHQRTYGPSETSKASIVFRESVLAAFDKTNNRDETEEDRDVEEEEISHQRTISYGPSETSKASVTFSESVLAAFDKPRPMNSTTSSNDKENISAIVDDKSEETSAHVSNESQETLEDSTVEYMEVDEYETPKKMSIGRKETPKMTLVDPEETPKKKSPYVKQPAEVAAPLAKEPFTTLSQPVKSRAALLLPRFMQQTTASASRANGPPVMCSSPVCGKKFVPPAPIKPKIHATPRKSIAVLRRVNNQSFNAAKLPILDMSQFEDIPKKVPPVKNRHSVESNERRSKRPHPVTPQQQKIPSKLPVRAHPVTPKQQKVPTNVRQSNAFNLLQQYASPSTPRVPAKRASPPPVEDLSKENVSQTSPLPRENILQNTIITDFNILSIDDENPRRLITNNDIAPVEAENNENDHGNFSAFVIPSDDDYEDESHDIDEPQINGNDENEQQSKDYDDSIYSINTPGPSRICPIIASKPLIPLNFNDTLGDNSTVDRTLNATISSNKSPIHITAALKKNQKKCFILAKPHLIKPESPSIEHPNLRRSKRTRVRTLRRDLGEQPVYELDENRLPVLVGVTQVEIKNPRAQKYLTADTALQNQREKELKNGNKKRKQFAKIQREIEHQF